MCLGFQQRLKRFRVEIFKIKKFNYMRAKKLKTDPSNSVFYMFSQAYYRIGSWESDELRNLSNHK